MTERKELLRERGWKASRGAQQRGLTYGCSCQAIFCTQLDSKTMFLTRVGKEFWMNGNRWEHQASLGVLCKNDWM